MNTILVVIPVWVGDYDTVIANLQRQFERDGKSQHHALISADASISKDHGKALFQAASSCFSKVHHYQVTVPQPREWPKTQNIAWQSTARHIETNEGLKCRCWFWWESDALPLKKGWIDTLSDAYFAGKKTFMGHIVPNHGHMNGVAMYPWNISAYCTNAMFVKSSPFDVTLAKEVSERNITNANHLIAHHLKIHGGDAPKPISNSVISSLPESTVIIHGYFEPSSQQIQTIKETRKEQAMNETSKAMRRRRCEEAAGGFKWSEIFKGNGVDVGAGNDPIQIPGCKPFDMMDGDANFLSRYFSKESLDYIHASQSLEHMIDPRAALLNWSICVKKGGHLVVTIPDFDLYEHRNWPSRFNSDHKSAWSMWRKSHAVAPIVHVPSFVMEMESHGLKTIISRLVDTNYDYTSPDDIDQTLPQDGAEAFIEMVFQKV